MVKHVRWDELKKELLNPKLERQHVSGKQLTLARLVMRKGLVTEEHSHLHEQFAYVLEGALKFTVNGQEQIVRSGEVISIPPNARHNAEALEDTINLDLFSPARTDWEK
jgi:quercetin dioxygenase-like cupin family protein